MSNLLTGIAPQAGLIAQSSGSTASQASRNAEGNAAQAQLVQNAVSSGAVSNPAAVVVSLSSQSKSRAASYGQGRGVDATFEKQGREGGKLDTGKDEEGDGKKKATVNVTA